MSNYNPTDKDADKNLSKCINPKETPEEKEKRVYWERQAEKEKEIFGR